jgi:TonB family protein
MPRRFWSVALALAASAAFAVPAPAVAHGRGDAVEALVPIWLPRPTYPVMAKAARVQGDVEVAVEVAADGHVVSATIVKGRPILDEAALEAARESYFLSRESDAPRMGYSLFYTFQLEARRWPIHAAVVDRDGSRLTTAAEIRETMYIHYSDLVVRGPKCLYLWRCGREWGGYHSAGYERRRAVSCLWLWRCGWVRSGD